MSTASASPRVRVGVIGAGSWAVASHIPTLASRPEVELVGVCRHGAQPLAEIAERFGFAHASEDYHDILDLGLDLVVISSPSALHAEHALAAMEAGAHVLVEKPFTLDPADAWRLAEAADRLDRRLVVAFGFNYRPLTVAAADLLAEHGIGEIETVQITMSTDTRALLTATGAYPKAAAGFAPEVDTWTDPARSGGGYAQAQLCHALGVALGLTGLRGERVYAAMRSPQPSRVELHDAFVLEFAGSADRPGPIGTMSGSSAHPGFVDGRDQLHILLVGSEGHLDLAYETDRVSLYRPDTGVHTRPVPDGAGSYDCVGPPLALLDLVLGRPVSNRSPAELGARATEILAAGYRSAASGQPEPVQPAQPDNDDEPAGGSRE